MSDDPPSHPQASRSAAIGALAAISWLFLFGGLLVPVSPSPTWAMVGCTYGVSIVAGVAALIGYCVFRGSGYRVSRIAALAAAVAIGLCFGALFGPAYTR